MLRANIQKVPSKYTEYLRRDCIYLIVKYELVVVKGSV